MGEIHNIALFSGLLVTLIATTFKLGRILERFESLEKRSVGAVETIPSMQKDVIAIKDSLLAVANRQARHDSYITQLRINAGITEDRLSQGGFGE